MSVWEWEYECVSVVCEYMGVSSESMSECDICLLMVF